MITDDINEAVEATLHWCNERRARNKMPPLDRLPVGYKGDPRSCPCGEATGLHIGTIWVDHDPKDVLPKLVQEFIALFDSGYLPKYDKDVIEVLDY